MTLHAREAERSYCRLLFVLMLMLEWRVRPEIVPHFRSHESKNFRLLQKASKESGTPSVKSVRRFLSRASGSHLTLITTNTRKQWQRTRHSKALGWYKQKHMIKMEEAWIKVNEWNEYTFHRIYLEFNIKMLLLYTYFIGIFIFQNAGSNVR